MLRSIFLGLLFASVIPSLAFGQVTSRGIIAEDALRRIGLERMWHAQIDFDTARGRLVGINQQINPENSYTLFEILDRGQRLVFSQNELDAFGEPIGVAGALRKAEQKLAQMKADLAKNGQPEPAGLAVTKHVVPEIRLYATSERGSVHAIDGETGRTIWSASVGNPNLPMSSACANTDMVAVCNGSRLYFLNADTGAVIYERATMGAPSTGPGMSEEYCFVPMINGNVEMYSLVKPSRPPYLFRSFGRPTAEPAVSQNSVCWPTERGQMYVGQADSASMRYRIEAKGSITAAPVFGKNAIYFGSHDGYIYCVQEQSGNTIWRFTTGDRISQSPLLIGSQLFAITDIGSLFCLDAKTGAEQWVAPGIRSFVSGNANRVYCVDRNGRIVAVDTKTGSRGATISALGLDVTVANQTTDRLIVGTSSGLIQCIREKTNHWPQYRDVNLVEEKKRPVRQLQKKNENDQKPADGGAPAGDDPFNGGGEMPATEEGDAADAPAADAADPFGGGDAEMKKEKKPAAKDEDPFG